jgi:PAS domain S-box-containing protein
MSRQAAIAMDKTILPSLRTDGTSAAATARSVPGERSARRRYERSFVRARERLALLASTKSLGFWTWNCATDAVWVSKHARSILGLSAKGRLTRDMLLAAIHPIDRMAVLRAIGRTTRRTDTVEMELRVTGHDHAARWVTAKASAYRDSNGMLLRVAGYVIDDTQRKHAEAEALQQQRQIAHLTRVAVMGELSGALAHELQQPLTAILCNAQAGELLAAKGHLNAEELGEIFREIIRDGKHAGEVIHHLRSHLMRGEMHLEGLDLRCLLREVLTLARSTLTKCNVQLDTHIDDGIPAVRGGRVEIQQVFLNLILNACESMHASAAKDRRIEIVAVLDQAGDFVHTSVLDCGRGIGQEQLQRIFEPFFTTKGGGLGLGLAVCHSIISAHKGRLWATNRADGGAALHFTLPIATTADPERAPQTATVADDRDVSSPRTLKGTPYSSACSRGLT